MSLTDLANQIGRNVGTDYHMLSSQDMDALLFDAFNQSLGYETRERIRHQLENYEYYDGKQHRNEYGALVKGSEVQRPAGLDYDPTRYTTNYFKAIIDRKARWQMGGKHGIQVPRKQIDPLVEAAKEGYTPSPEQQAENEKSDAYEKLLYQLWRENKMRTKLIQAARDRLVADRAVCKIVFNPNTGKLRWIWRPDTEFIPIYSEDDFEDMVACHFVKVRKEEIKGTEVEVVLKQTFRLIEGTCWIEEAVYKTSDLSLVRVIQEPQSLGLDFIPVVEFPVDELLGGETGDGEISDLREQNDVINQMNEDAIDSLKFEMFPMTAIFNAPDGTASKLQVAPGAVVEMRGHIDTAEPNMRKIESGFRWKDAFKDQYARVKGAMHEISGLPQVVPQELNFGGLNGEALQVLFHDIITNTEEHWLTWGYGLSDLHEKSIRYLQARTDHSSFAYDREQITKIDDYTNEMRFVLPLPDNRKELVDLLTIETANGFESVSGAIERLGVEDVQAKKQEVEGERAKRRQQTDVYFEGGEREDGETSL